MFSYGAFPVLHTRRLTLRELVATDADAVFRIRGDYQVTKHNTGAAYTHIGEASDLIKSIRYDYETHQSVRWGITQNGDDTVIGLVGYNYWVQRDNRASVGYDLARLYWGQGMMPEALNAVIDWGFEEMELNRIEADCGVLNVNSARVLLKVGFQLEGSQREQYYDAEQGGYQDLLLFGLLRRDYEEHTALD